MRTTLRFLGRRRDSERGLILPLAFRAGALRRPRPLRRTRRARSDSRRQPARSSRARCRSGRRPSGGKPIERNATAEVLVERGGELGIPFERAARAATSEASEAFSNAGARAWLESQLAIPDESIGEPPKALKQYLEESKAALEAIVSALERQAPDWGRDEVDKKGTVNTPALTPSLRLQSVLLAAALIETRAGREIEAERLLEASWSLARPAAAAPVLITQIIAVRSGRWQAGVLRKMRGAPLPWIDRFSSDRSWSDMLDAYAADAEPRESPSLAPSSDPREEIDRKAPAAIAAGLKKLGPCEGASLDDEGLWKLAERELFPSSDPATVEARDGYREITLPNMVNPVRGAGRLAVDRELTLEILRLRLSKEQDAEGRWPARMETVVSIACPSAEYVYRANAGGMEIRFEGAAPAPDRAVSAAALIPRRRRTKADGLSDADIRSLDTHTRRRDDRSAMTARSVSNLVVAGDPVGRSRALPNSFGRGRSRRENENPRPERLGGF